MPTGYTAAVQDGTITTLHDYAMTCARAFGALIHMRDDPAEAPIPGRIEPSNYYVRELAQAKARLAHLKAMSPMQAQRECQQQYSAALARWRDRTLQDARQRVRYIKMIDHVEAWRPPTTDHNELKNFMLKQLSESVEWDCGGKSLTMPRLQRWPDWLRDEVTHAEREISYCARKANEEDERAASRTAWLQALRGSLRGDAS